MSVGCVSRFPFPRPSKGCRERETGNSWGSELVTVLGLEDVALLRELVESFAEALGTDPAGLSELSKRQRRVGLLQGDKELFRGRSRF